jgi:hypothetical protein
MDFGAGRISDIGAPSIPRFTTSADVANGKHAAAIALKQRNLPLSSANSSSFQTPVISAVRNRDARLPAIGVGNLFRLCVEMKMSFGYCFNVAKLSGFHTVVVWISI